MKRLLSACAALTLALGGVSVAAGPASAMRPTPGGGCSGHTVLDAKSYKRIDPRVIIYIPGRDVLLVNCTTHTYIVNVRCANPAKISTNSVCWTKRVRKESIVKVSVPFYKSYTRASWYR